MTATTLTLPGAPVTRSITWEQIEKHLREQGWEATPASGGARWTKAGVTFTLYTYPTDLDDVGFMEIVVKLLARLDGCSPGEMLARITDDETPEETSRRDHLLAFLQDGVSDEDVDAIYEHARCHLDDDERETVRSRLAVMRGWCSTEDPSTPDPT